MLDRSADIRTWPSIVVTLLQTNDSSGSGLRQAARTGIEDPNFMTSLARGLAVIRAFSGQHPSLSIADVARRTALPRAAVRRCLLTLMRLGYVGSDGRLFFLRSKILALGYAFVSSTPLAAAIGPTLERVSETLHESCSVGVLDDDEVVYIARAETKRIMSVTLSVGSRLPAYCTSMGRVLLASLSASELDAYLERVPLRAYTERTVTEAAALRKVIEQVRQRGHALVDQELEIALRSVAVPVRNATGTVVAAMNASTHAARVGRREMETRFVPVLEAAAEEARSLLVT